MLTVINGFDITKYVLSDTIECDQSINDIIPKSSFDVNDEGSLLSFDFGMECIIWDENAPDAPTDNPAITAPTVPSHNLVQLPDASGAWTTYGPLSIFSGFPGLSPTVTFNNITYSGGNNYQLIYAISPAGHIHPGQKYMLSAYVTCSAPLTNAQGFLKIDWLDAASATIGGASISTLFSSTTDNAEQRITLSGTAPSNAAYIVASLGGQANVSGTNSGTIIFRSPQCEPMYFADTSLHWNVSYPTPECNYNKVNCSKMPDGTVSRTCRIFSGFIDDFDVEYDSPNRIWHISCAGPGALLENGNINATFTGQTDATIITTLVASYFAGQLSTSAPNSTSANPIQAGIVEDSIVYSDNSLREVLNGFIDKSGFVAFVDMYYTIRYQPSFYNVASFVLNESPDNITSFAYSKYKYKKDGTQTKRRIKITGAKFTGTRTDVFSGNGTNKQFTLTYVPNNITFIQVTGTNQKLGVYGRDSLGASFDVLVNKESQYLLFNTAPPNASNNVVVTYSYEAPISTQAVMQGSGLPIIPAYAIPLFDSKINDTNITSLPSATQRGLAEIAKAGNPREIINLSCEKFAPAGIAIYITHARTGITSKPYVIQSVRARFMGNGQNEYDYTLGSFNPSIIDHLRNANKAMNRSTTVSGVTAPQQVDVVATETIAYNDSLSAVPVASYSPSAYGTAHYGSNAYGGTTGAYGQTAQYGRSTIYG